MHFNLKIFTGNKFCLFNYATKNQVVMLMLTGSESIEKINYNKTKYHSYNLKSTPCNLPTFQKEY